MTTDDTPDFGPTGYAKDTAEGVTPLNANLTDILGELESINVQTANIQNATLSVDRPLRFAAGTPIFLEQFEYGDGFWVSASSGTGSSSAVSTTQFWSKGRSWKLVAGSDGGRTAKTKVRMGRYKTAKIGFQFAFTMDADLDYFALEIAWRTGTHYWYPALNFDVTNDTLEILDENDTWQTVQSGIDLYEAVTCFHFVKMIVDLTTVKYETLYLNDVEIDLSAYGFPDYGSPGTDPLVMEFNLRGDTGKNATVYLDDICVTEEG